MTDQTQTANGADTDASTSVPAVAPTEEKPKCVMHGSGCADERGRDPLWIVRVKGEPPAVIHDCCMPAFRTAAKDAGLTVGGEDGDVKFEKSDDLREIQKKLRKERTDRHEEKVAKKADAGARRLLAGMLKKRLAAASDASAPAQAAE